MYEWRIILAEEGTYHQLEYPNYIGDKNQQAN